MTHKIEKWTPECLLAMNAKVQLDLISPHVVFKDGDHDYAISYGSTNHDRLTIYDNKKMLGHIYMSTGEIDVENDSLLLRMRLESFVRRYNSNREVRDSHHAAMLAKADRKIEEAISRKEQLANTLHQLTL